ncbi:MAG: hypothetical protein ACFFDO_03150 [Candidatus Thorarchaeota archaeon]
MPEKIKLAIVGIGNAASALIQGIEYYRSGSNNERLLRPTLAGYHISEFFFCSKNKDKKLKIKKH